MRSTNVRLAPAQHIVDHRCFVRGGAAELRTERTTRRYIQTEDEQSRFSQKCAERHALDPQTTSQADFRDDVHGGAEAVELHIDVLFLEGEQRIAHVRVTAYKMSVESRMRMLAAHGEACACHTAK